MEITLEFCFGDFLVLPKLKCFSVRLGLSIVRRRIAVPASPQYETDHVDHFVDLIFAVTSRTFSELVRDLKMFVLSTFLAFRS